MRVRSAMSVDASEHIHGHIGGQISYAHRRVVIYIPIHMGEIQGLTHAYLTKKNYSFGGSRCLRR
jgi:hypothetical protein